MNNSQAPGPSASAQQRLPFDLARTAILLAFSILINYIDRGTLSIAAPILKDDLHLTASQLGVLLSSFFWTYASFQLVSGWLVDRFNVNWLLAAGVLLWSVATVTTGLVNSFFMLLTARLVLGVGESVGYPSCNKIIAKHFQATLRGRANGLVSAGWALGPAIGTFVGGMLVARVGWRWFFIVLGLASLLWLIPWMMWMPKGPGLVAAGKAPASASIAEILRQRSAWGTFLGLFCFNYQWYFLITWLPFYLVRQRGFSLQALSAVGGIVFFLLSIVALAAGWIADRWITASRTATVPLKALCGGGMVIASFFFILVFLVTNHIFAMVLLVLSCLGLGLCSPNLWTMTQVLAGPETTGRWTGLENFCGNLAGISGPIVAGFLLDLTGNFFWAFAVTSTVSLIGAASYAFLVGPVVPVKWFAEVALEAPTHQNQATTAD